MGVVKYLSWLFAPITLTLNILILLLHRARQAETWTSEAHRRSSASGASLSLPLAGRGLHLGSSASSADDRQGAAGDPFSVLDPLNRPPSRTEPMHLSRSSKSWDGREPSLGVGHSISGSTEGGSEKQDIKNAGSTQGSLLDL